MDMERYDRFREVNIRDLLARAHEELNEDYVGFWSIISSGRGSYLLSGADLREFAGLYVFNLISHGAIVIEPARDGVHWWKSVSRYGTTPEDIAKAVVAEWVEQGEPDLPSWEGLAFTIPEILAAEDNLLAWHKQALKDLGY